MHMDSTNWTQWRKMYSRGEVGDRWKGGVRDGFGQDTLCTCKGFEEYT